MSCRTAKTQSSSQQKEYSITELLEKAIIGLNNLPDEQQDPMARWILEELQDEQKWDTAFANSLPQLEQLAKKALKEHQNK